MQRQQQQQTHNSKQRLFTASEVAEFEYCPLVWWHEQFEPLVAEDTEELFARLVEMEEEHGTQAPSLPEYQFIEQLLLRRGAFEEGRQQHRAHAKEVEKVQEERITTTRVAGDMRKLALVALMMLVIALILIVVAILFHQV
jgi:hypothetical protein